MRLFSRTIWVLGAMGLIAVLAVYFSTSSPDYAQGEGNIAAVSEADAFGELVREQFGNQDSDNDGLRDWEEALWNTDANNPDTDGDGSEDGEEVDQNRNPLVAGPEDILTSNVFVESNEGSTEREPLNATDQAARAFFTDYITLRQSGQLEGGFGESFLLQQVNNHIPSLEDTSYALGDIVTISETATSLETYGNALGTLLLTASFSGGQNELDILEDAFIRGQQEKLAELAPIREEFRRVIGSVNNLAVPEGLGVEHVDLLNGLSNVEKALRGLENTYQDPLTGLASLQLYQTNAQVVVDALNSIASYFAENEVHFENNQVEEFFRSLAS